jgi:hypothetical protein
LVDSFQRCNQVSRSSSECPLLHDYLAALMASSRSTSTRSYNIVWYRREYGMKCSEGFSHPVHHPRDCTTADSLGDCDVGHKQVCTQPLRSDTCVDKFLDLVIVHGRVSGLMAELPTVDPAANSRPSRRELQSRRNQEAPRGVT